MSSQGENWLTSIIFASLYVLKRPKGKEMEKWVKREKMGMKKGVTLGFFKLSGCRIAKHYKRRAFLLKKYSLGGGQSTRRSVFHENRWIPASAGMTKKRKFAFL